MRADTRAADKAAVQEYNEDTKEAFDRYKRIWKPAREKWEKFQQPHFRAVQAKLAANGKAETDALAEVLSNWKTCPKCGASASKYQTYCITEKCGGIPKR